MILEGSRTNPNVKSDRFQDFDIVYIVTEMTSFLDDPSWIDRFGERIILQTPEAMIGEPPRENGGFSYLMQFTDGNRIDLMLIPINHIHKIGEDSLRIPLMDKDNLFAPFPPPSEDSYLPTPPSEKAYADCCNEFWWIAPYVAKGLARDQILFAKHMLDSYLRVELMKMLTWLFGSKTNFQRNPGKVGKHFKEVLSHEQWEQLLATYSTAEIDATWDALLTMRALFRDCAREVGGTFDFTYPEEDDERVSKYLLEIREMHDL